LLLVTFPLEDEWVVFAQDDQALRVLRLPALDVLNGSHEELAKKLLVPLAKELARNERVVVMPTGTARALDFHALPVAGRPLLATHRVSYSLDLPLGPPGDRPHERVTKASTLIVADPRGDLPRARQEGLRVRELTSGDLRFVSGREATASNIRALIPTVGTFHYSGHGHFVESDGLASALSLAEDTRLSVSDVLALQHTPERVVLMGCETAKSTADMPLESLGLAQAFLVGGSGVVAASTRPIRDILGERFAELLYEQPHSNAPDPGVDPIDSFERAVQDAQRALYQRHPESDWASFRALIP